VDEEIMCFQKMEKYAAAGAAAYSAKLKKKEF
jgi:hypothetical protein